MKARGLNHLGIAVPDIAAARAFYETALGAVFEGEENVADQGVRAAFFRLGDDHGGVRIELLQPLDDNSAVAKFLANRGPGLHHVAYTVDDVAEGLAAAAKAGIKLIDTVPRRGAHGAEIAFLHPHGTGGVLTELCRPAADHSPSPTLDADSERHGRAAANPPIHNTIGEKFANCAATRPMATAITFRGRTISYGELHAMSERVAAGLHKQGVRRGDLVGVYCQRSPELIAVALGLWRCGAVYVPLDPKYPSRRLTDILTDCAPRLVVSDAPLPSHLTLQAQAVLDAAALCASADAEPPPANAAATLDDRAVVLYTSGSTGRPKGAILSHHNLANHNAYVVREFGLSPEDRRTAVCSINFDASLEEFFCTLTAGATLVLPDSDTLDSFDRFLAFLESQRITTLFMPTSLWRELTNFLHASKRAYPRSLRLIDLGGERVTRPIYERFLEVGGNRIRWVNVYGPTECSIYATTYEHDPIADATRNDAPPIGRPIDNVRLYILDEHRNPCRFGEVGELYIGGAGVGEGYLNRPELTAERYLDRPSPALPPGRYYRTGDQVRFRGDGQLEYVGRLDDQVKLRGFRIEPGEIEAVLQRHPAVRDAAVVVRTSTLGSPYLAAYVVLHPDAPWDAHSLGKYCAERLPDYMVPGALVKLDALPQSPNGKVDRFALPDPYLDDQTAREGTAAHSDRKPNELERRLLEVWREELCFSELGIDDDFFALGGDSLRAMALAARMEAALGRPVPAALLLTAPTVARLAVLLSENSIRTTEAVVLMRDGDRTRPLFMVHSLGGDVWIYHELVRRLESETAVYGLQLPTSESAASAAAESFEECAARHIERLRSVQPHGPYRIAGYSSGGMLAYEMARRLAGVGEHVEFLGLLDAGVPPAWERRLAPTRQQKLATLVRNVPLLLAELRSVSPARNWRRLKNLLRRFLPRLISPNAAAASDAALLNCFAQDISFFSAARLAQIKSHFAAVERYEAGPWNGTADLFRVRRQALSAVPTRTLGWEHLINGDVAVHDVDGTHDSMLEFPHVQSLANAFDAALQHRPTASLTAQCCASQRAAVVSG